MNVNYITEINALHDWEFTHPLGATAFKLLLKLYYLANRERFPVWFKAPNCTLTSLVGCSEDSLTRARQKLINDGRILYRGQKRKTPMYSIRYFSVKNDKSPDFAGYSADYSADYSAGYSAGYSADTYINKTKENGKHDDITVTSEIGDIRLEDIRLQARSSKVTYLSNSTGRAPGTRSLSKGEAGDYAALRTCIDADYAGDEETRGRFRLYADGDRYPLKLVCEAYTRTHKRNSAAALDDPCAYMAAILREWENEGIRTAEELAVSERERRSSL